GISKVIATSGKGNDNDLIAPEFGSRFYGSYEYVQMRDHQSINLSYFNINDAVANGDTRKQDFLNQWGLNRVQQARMGDIIKVCNAEGKISFARDSKVYQLKKENFPNIDQAIFFQMTPAGFVPLHVNQLKTLPVDVPQNATDAELDAAFPKTLNLRDNIIAECFAGRPDVSKPGKTKAVVRAIEKLYDGKYAKFDYEVELNVIPAGELTVKPGQYVLGERWGMQSIERMFTQAQQRDGTPVLWGDKQLYPLKAPDVEKHLQLGTQRIDELFKDAAAPIQFDSKTGHLTARPTATANYGDAIILKGYELRSGRDAGGAFALIHDDGLKVVATAGGSKDNQPIHNRFPSEPYLGITHVPMKDEKVKNLSEVAVKWASGDLGKQDFLNLWGKDRVQPVEAGDIIKVVNVERKIRYTHDSQEQPLNDLANKNELYFEITDQGYQLLRVNQLVPQKANIPINASAAEMDLRLSQFFKFPDKSTYRIKGFKERPDVSKLGETTATVTVSQKYGKDKTIEADYDVPVAVVKRATFSTQSQTLKLGEVVTTDTLGNMLKDAREYDDRRIQWGDKALSVTMPDKLDKLLRKDTKRLTKISKPIDVTMKFEASTGTVLSTSPVLTDYG
ncbi:cell surface protein, partial [Lacticaseibacillus rhamnosus]